MSHTKGPWNYQPLMADGVIISPAKGGRFEITTPEYDVCAYIVGSAPIRKEDDARLIAAAPELMLACIEALRLIASDTTPYCPGEEPVIEALTAAIAKAKGEE